MVDWQAAFNIAIGLAGVLFGWMVRVIWDGQKDLRRDIAELSAHIPDNYVRRDDFKDTAMAIFKKLDRIEDKLDGKADKGV